MVFVYVLAAWIGGLATVLALWNPCGAVAAIVAAPFGGSALTVLAAACLYVRTTPRATAATGATPGAHPVWSR